MSAENPEIERRYRTFVTDFEEKTRTYNLDSVIHRVPTIELWKQYGMRTSYMGYLSVYNVNKNEAEKIEAYWNKPLPPTTTTPAPAPPAAPAPAPAPASPAPPAPPAQMGDTLPPLPQITLDNFPDRSLTQIDAVPWKLLSGGAASNKLEETVKMLSDQNLLTGQIPAVPKTTDDLKAMSSTDLIDIAQKYQQRNNVLITNTNENLNISIERLKNVDAKLNLINENLKVLEKIWPLIFNDEQIYK